MSERPKKRPNETKVEELLRLKRHEKPDAAFWNRFEGELHQRMLQTLVKKDPWYIQITHALSTRVVQTVLAASAAAFLAMVVMRPVTVQDPEPAKAEDAAQQAAWSEAEETEAAGASFAATKLLFDGLLDFGTKVELEADQRDYRIEAITPETVDSEPERNFERSFAMDSMRGSAYEAEVYSEEPADRQVSFGSASVASMVY
ncbi:MAG: hypothetical protein ACLFUF_01355 [Opitutales bacterium]